MTPKRGGSVVVIGNSTGTVGRVDRRGQCIEQLAKPPFALAHDRLRPHSIGDRHNVVGRGRGVHCRYRTFEFALKKSDRLVHCRPAWLRSCTRSEYQSGQTTSRTMQGPPQRQRAFGQMVARIEVIFSRLPGLSLIDADGPIDSRNIEGDQRFRPGLPLRGLLGSVSSVGASHAAQPNDRRELTLPPRAQRLGPAWD